MEAKFCAVKGRRATDNECSGIIIKADAATIETCRTCTRGQALKQTAENWTEHSQQTPPALQETKPEKPKATAWEIVRIATGCNTFAKLGLLTGFSDQAVRIQLAKLDKGKLPRAGNKVLPAILRVSKLTLADLPPAGAIEQGQQEEPASEPEAKAAPRDAAKYVAELPGDELPPADSSAASSAAPEAHSGHMMAMQDAPDKTAGSEDAEQMLDAAESPGKGLLENPFMIVSFDTLDEYAAETKRLGIEVRPPDEECECDEGYGPCDACASCRPGLYVHDSRGKSHPRPDLPIHLLPLLNDEDRAAFEQGLFAETPAPVGLPPLSQHLLDKAQIDADACAALPADFQPYTGQRPVLHGKPALHIKKGGDMELSVDAVALGCLEHAGHVRPFWSDLRKQIGLAPVDDTGPGVLKLQITPSKRRRISASGFLNGFDIRPAPGTYPVERHASGLLVATITQQPAQTGGEA